ncbi:MAG: PHP domain-containing protein [Acutalibacteraceae bacterium]|nr:PHP domain-containing protein [Acutalibacteraceae bacterium]
MISLELFNYDIFPKVFPCDKAIEVTVKPLGAHVEFKGEYTVWVKALTQGNIRDYKERNNLVEYSVTPDEDGCIRFTHTYKDEQEHFVEIIKDGKRVVRLSVYSLNEDMVGRYPFRGDLHMHTCRSDGHQAPAIVAAEYRKNGYDFLAITDHDSYYPSLEAINAFKDAPVEYTLVTGEEVHLEDNDIHIVNFGGKYSVNALMPGDHHIDVGPGKELRSLDGECPEIISVEEYKRQVNELAETLDIPEGIEKFTYASCVWIFNHIKKADGLGIFCHPYWISNVFQVPETLVEHMMETQPFDAFEVLGGEAYYQQNGFQAARYYDDRAKGRRYPIVGSTDSHACVDNDEAFVASTIVFSFENTREGLISAIKDMYSVAVDSISKEHRLVGETRFIRYGDFLLREFFPLHDELVFEEGRLMKDYVCGDESAIDILKAINGRMKKQREKYFSF